MLKKVICAVTVMVVAAFLMAQSSTVVVIASRSSYLNQSGNLPTTTIYTPSTNQNVRVNVYISELNVPPTGGGVSPFIQWTDEVGLRNTNYGLQYNWFSLSLPIRAVANTPIQIAVSASSNQMYDVWVTVELL